MKVKKSSTPVIFKIKCDNKTIKQVDTLVQSLICKVYIFILQII